MQVNVPLIIFDSILEHFLLIDRVLKQPINHLLLIGQCYVGKTILSVAWMNILSIFQKLVEIMMYLISMQI